MLQDPQAIRYYQNLSDALVDSWHRGYRFDNLRLYIDGYLACLRETKVLEPFLVHRIEEEAIRFLRDPSNFEDYALPEPETRYY
ncbi:hypothetical protein KR51_00003690 [Rubidibacter lacunae KORDI 51-2]|uniref:Uncharacterized protein n=1 Tax=Rubidibacter lacunae KORDI 51-2 TaxID=582515 RepID=U5DEY3_9CHRO|nr:DUF6761 family protein [Rubidibacter lacunae]ERN43053.1 hypothetical protein KR51_00003690 [Rubidibacter lacunae KORDI 51-2]